MNNKLINTGLFQIVGNIADLLDWFGEKEKSLLSSPPISTELDTLDKQLADIKVHVHIFIQDSLFKERNRDMIVACILNLNFIVAFPGAEWRNHRTESKIQRFDHTGQEDDAGELTGGWPQAAWGSGGSEE